MRELIIIFLIVLIIISLWHGTTRKEGFVVPLNGTPYDKIQNEIQNRSNPLASQQNPLTNPMNLGLSVSDSAALRSMYNSAMDVPIQTGDGRGGLKMQPRIDQINPRIDNAGSFLALVDYCKKTGATTDPFKDPTFAQNCGMCMSKGRLITGERFEVPTGVVVYAEDKNLAYTTQTRNK
jgi:hypothetical protein